MKNAIIIHGKPDREEYYNPEVSSSSNWHWIPWLQKQLLVNDIPAQTPEMPFSFKPEYNIWKKEFERYDILPQTLLVGHSCGGGFLVRWLSEHKYINVEKVVLVAPWIDPEHELKNNFFDFKIDTMLVKRTSGVIVFSSDNDHESVQKTVKILKKNISDASFRLFHNYGHFTYDDMKTQQFPELLDELL